MVTLLTGASHTGKTLLAQRLIERRPCFCLSLDHLKMGLIRSGYTSLTPEDDLALTDYLWPIARGDSQNRHRKRPGPDPGGLLHPLYLAAGLPPGVPGAPPLSLPGDDRGLSPGELFPGAGLREPGGAPAKGPLLHLGAGPGGKPLLLGGLPGPGAHPSPHPPQLDGRPALVRFFRQLFVFWEEKENPGLVGRVAAAVCFDDRGGLRHRKSSQSGNFTFLKHDLDKITTNSLFHRKEFAIIRATGTGGLSRSGKSRHRPGFSRSPARSS